MSVLDLPKTFQFGEIEYVELKHLETTFKITRRVARKYLKVLRIKPLYIRDEIYFSISTFNRIMYVLSRPGSPGFLFPGSKEKGNKQLRGDGYLIEVTDDILVEANSPRVLAEMAAASGRDPSMIKKLLTHPPQKRRKEKQDEDSGEE